ncbi:MAG TPA: YraN family protein [Gammaproteobacteria bacterium]|nr:YraN family protein [Gammaproteobacteria bacterium]
MKRAERGARAESQAADWLKRKGLKLLERNVRSRFGEIDLVMEDDDTLVFVEVRYRSRDDYGGAVASVTPAKRARLQRAIGVYIASHPKAGSRNLRADVVAISGQGNVEWIPNAFEGAL